MQILERSRDSFGVTGSQNPRELEELMHESYRYVNEGETSYIAAERRRQIQGYFTLLELCNLQDPQINQILGIDRVPRNFKFKEAYLKPSAEHEVRTYITITDSCPYERLKGLSLEVRGIRVQVNMADRKGEARALGKLTQTGGGVRVGFKEGHEIGENTYRIRDGEQVMTRVRDEARALAAAMLPKIMGLQFPRQFADFLQTAKLDPDISRNELLAKAVDFYPAGGAKADIVIAAPDLPNKEKMNQDEMTYIIGRAFYQVGYILGKKGAVGPELDRLAGDVGSGVKHPVSNKAVLNDLAEGIIAGVRERMTEKSILQWTEELERYYMATVTGKSGGFGLNAREEATGLGAWAAWLSYEQHYARQNNIPIDENGIPAHMKGMRVFFRGCGNASYRTIKEAAKAEVVVHGISELGALIISEDEKGFTPSDALELYHVSIDRKLGDLHFGSIAEWAEWKMQQDSSRKIKVIYKDNTGDGTQMIQDTGDAVNQYFDEYQPKRVIEAASQGTINYKNAHRVHQNSVVIEIANGPVTPEGGRILSWNGVEWLPGILVNSGGVDVSLFESIRNILGIKSLDKDDIEKSVVKLMMQNMSDVFAIREHLSKQRRNVTESMRERKIDLPLESIYYALAMARAIKAEQELAEIVRQEKVSNFIGEIFVRLI